jgi:hypothetical protein
LISIDICGVLNPDERRVMGRRQQVDAVSDDEQLASISELASEFEERRLKGGMQMLLRFVDTQDSALRDQPSGHVYQREHLLLSRRQVIKVMHQPGAGLD